MRTLTQRFPLWASRTHVGGREARRAGPGSEVRARGPQGPADRAKERASEEGKRREERVDVHHGPRCRSPSPCPQVSKPRGWCGGLQPCRNALLRCSLHSWCPLTPNLQHMRQSLPANPSEHTHTPRPPPPLFHC